MSKYDDLFATTAPTGAIFADKRAGDDSERRPRGLPAGDGLGLRLAGADKTLTTLGSPRAASVAMGATTPCTEPRQRPDPRNRI